MVKMVSMSPSDGGTIKLDRLDGTAGLEQLERRAPRSSVILVA
jgi:hypothetical protein